MGQIPQYGGLSAYPVGSIYISINSTSPSELFGGTWGQINNCFLLAQGNRFTAGSTGGEERHTLSVAEMPEHNHWVRILARGYDRWGNDGYSDYEYTTGSWSNPPAYGGSHAHTSHVIMGQTGKDGGSQSHNNMPPYLTVYMWKRIS